MAVIPNVPIIVVADEDVSLPSTGQPNKAEPNSSIQTTGYDDNQVVTAENLNYLLNTISKWQTYFNDKIDELETQIQQERVSIGEVIEITGNPTNPSILKGYGTWEAFGAGRVTVGVGTYIDSRGESKTWADGDMQGTYKHQMVINEMPEHAHEKSGIIPDALTSGFDISNPRTALWTLSDSNTIYDVKTATTGQNTPMNNIQPTMAVYKWKRVA